MKLLILFTTFLFCTTIKAQEVVFIGKIEYVKESKLLSNEYVSKGNGESQTYFNNSSYAFVQSSSINIEDIVNRQISTMPKEVLNEIGNDSFAMARHKQKLMQQLESQVGSSAISKTFIDFKTHVALKPKKIEDKNYCVIDSLPKPNWELKEYTLAIEGLLCQKARGLFIGKYFTVWFAPSVPFSAGPLNMHGLPGIIVLATSEDEKTRYRMKTLTYPLANQVKLLGCRGEKEISNTEYLYLQSGKRAKIKQDMEDFKNEKK